VTLPAAPAGTSVRVLMLPVININKNCRSVEGPFSLESLCGRTVPLPCHSISLHIYQDVLLWHKAVLDNVEGRSPIRSDDCTKGLDASRSKCWRRKIVHDLNFRSGSKHPTPIQNTYTARKWTHFSIRVRS